MFYGIYGGISLISLFVICSSVLGKEFVTGIITFLTANVLLYILAKWGNGYIMEVQEQKAEAAELLEKLQKLLMILN